MDGRTNGWTLLLSAKGKVNTFHSNKYNICFVGMSKKVTSAGFWYEMMWTVFIKSVRAIWERDQAAKKWTKYIDNENERETAQSELHDFIFKAFSYAFHNTLDFSL